MVGDEDRGGVRSNRSITQLKLRDWKLSVHNLQIKVGVFRDTIVSETCVP